MKFKDELKTAFGTDNLYEVLQVERDASASALKKAYYKRSLVVHPDRNVGSATATVQFQLLGKTYSILSDKDRRSIYDESGEVDDEDDCGVGDGDKDWAQYWRLLFPRVTKKQIDAFFESYSGSQEQIDELTRLYQRHNGDMDRIMEHSLDSDETAVRRIIDELISKEELDELAAYAKENASKKKRRKVRAAKEAREAEQLAEEMGLNRDDSLEQMIAKRAQQRHRQAAGFLDQLEAKYSKATTTSSGRTGSGSRRAKDKICQDASQHIRIFSAAYHVHLLRQLKSAFTVVF